MTIPAKVKPRAIFGVVRDTLNGVIDHLTEEGNILEQEKVVMFDDFLYTTIVGPTPPSEQIDISFLRGIKDLALVEESIGWSVTRDMDFINQTAGKLTMIYELETATSNTARKLVLTALAQFTAAEATYASYPNFPKSFDVHVRFAIQNSDDGARTFIGLANCWEPNDAVAAQKKYPTDADLLGRWIGVQVDQASFADVNFFLRKSFTPVAQGGAGPISVDTGVVHSAGGAVTFHNLVISVRENVGVKVYLDGVQKGATYTWEDWYGDGKATNVVDIIDRNMYLYIGIEPRANNTNIDFASVVLDYVYFDFRDNFNRPFFIPPA